MLRTCDLKLFICFKGVVYIVITILCVYRISMYLSIFFIILQNSENNNCERHEVNDQFGSFQLQ